MTEPADDTVGCTVYRVAERLPPFWTDRPALWFAQAETQFGLIYLFIQPATYVALDMSIQVTAREYNKLNKYGYLSTRKQNLGQLKQNYRYIKYKSLNKLSCGGVLKFKINKNNSIQGVPGGKDLTSGECSLGQTIPI